LSVYIGIRIGVLELCWGGFLREIPKHVRQINKEVLTVFIVAIIVVVVYTRIAGV
jgi:hypothetical protein